LAGPHALDRIQGILVERGFAGRLWVVADRLALRLHGERLRQAFPDAPVLETAGDEPSKTLSEAARVWDWLLAHGAQRQDGLVAFGGGVVCDLVGFAAACYLRGIGLVNVPTTLLAQVDASVGGKTGVNHERGKNLIGAFHQPLAVAADTGLLRTLSRRAFANGMAEVAKIAMAMNAELFDRLEATADGLDPEAADALTPVIVAAIELKAGVVERDEREQGERMLLNYGHTIGHALEASSGYSALLHGEAVSVGMEAAAFIARAMGMLDAPAAERQRRLLAALSLPLRAEGLDAGDVLSRLRLDKKRAGSEQRWILAERVGHAVIRSDVPEDVARAAVHQVLGA
jgi:3-dehydroquinate synthase